MTPVRSICSVKTTNEVIKIIDNFVVDGRALSQLAADSLRIDLLARSNAVAAAAVVDSVVVAVGDDRIAAVAAGNDDRTSTDRLLQYCSNVVGRFDRQAFEALEVVAQVEIAAVVAVADIVVVGDETTYRIRKSWTLVLPQFWRRDYSCTALCQAEAFDDVVVAAAADGDVEATLVVAAVVDKRLCFDEPVFSE